ncbi:MAG: STAS domain-containing protein [Sulfuriflexus sp.]|nr:STAS domain-containing protein [Sulfuriflexus sp.]
MPISVTTTNSDNIIRINIIDKFDYGVHREFREAYKNSDSSSEFIIDMSQTSYMDSSALGMLLLLREHSGNDSSKISITGCTAEIRNILKISKFQNLFNIK